MHDIAPVSSEQCSLVVASIHAMASGTLSDFEPLYDSDAVDHENRVQPPASRVPGAAGFFATAEWLRAAYADLRYEIHHAIADGDLIAVNSTMLGRQVAPFALYTPEGRIDTVFPPTGKDFATTQSHWFRLRDGRILEHWANRDDMGHAQQLGWLPPTPGYLVRMTTATRRAKRHERRERRR